MIDKSILIISTPRTGSSSLLYSFMDKFNIFDEPLNPFKIDKSTTSAFFNLIQTETNIVVKTMIDHIPYDYSSKGKSVTLDIIIDFYLDIIKEFDVVVLLDRTDVNAQIESNKRVSLDYHQKNNFKYDIEKSLKYLFYQKYLIRELSDKLNMNLSFYEELYYGDTKNTLKNSGIDLDWVDLTKFDNSRKYRGNLYSPHTKKFI